MKEYIFTIYKPLDGKNGRFVCLREIYLRDCIRSKCRTFVKIPAGVAEIDPNEWIRTGKRIEKVFLNPKVPMILWQNYVPIPKVINETPTVVEVKQQKTLFCRNTKNEV